MSSEERKQRWLDLYQSVSQHSSEQWIDDFISEIQKIHGELSLRYSVRQPLLTWRAIEKQYMAATNRLYSCFINIRILLSYDGTLEPYSKRGLTGNTEKIDSILTALTSDKRNAVYILSAKQKDWLSARFENVPNLGLRLLFYL